MNAPTAAGSWPVDIGAYGGWLFDLDGVLTKTAEVHAAAWKRAFDEFLDIEAERTNRASTPFDPVADCGRYVDGEPRADGVRNFLASRDIEPPEGSDGDEPDARTVIGLGNHKNESASLSKTGLFDLRSGSLMCSRGILRGHPVIGGSRALDRPVGLVAPGPAAG